MDGSGDWDTAYQKAVTFVKQLTLLEKVNLTTGVRYVHVDWACYQTLTVAQLGRRGMCRKCRIYSPSWLSITMHARFPSWNPFL
jgi:hypothetical protein